jgi:hypothetical protein
MGGAAMPTVAPHVRLLNSARQQRLHRAAHALALADDLEELSRVPTVDTDRIEVARHRLQGIDSAANLLEHASSRT